MLWTAIAALQREQPQLLCLVYTGDDLSKQSILQKVKVGLGRSSLMLLM